MKRPIFSIITPTLNSEKYITKCIESVENQKFKNWEHIFIDSFSKDKTLKILKEYKKRNPNKVFIYQFPKAGISDAFNKGISKTNGKWINFLGSDDLLEENSLKIVCDKIKSNKFTWCYGNVKIINDVGDCIKVKKYSNFSYKSLLYFFYICHQSVFVNKKLFDIYGLFDINLKYVMDHDFYLRIGKDEKPLKINKVLCSFRKSEENATSKNWREMLKEREIVSLNYAHFIEKPILKIIKIFVSFQRNYFNLNK